MTRKSFRETNPMPSLKKAAHLCLFQTFSMEAIRPSTISWRNNKENSWKKEVKTLTHPYRLKRLALLDHISHWTFRLISKSPLKSQVSTWLGQQAMASLQIDRTPKIILKWVLSILFLITRRPWRTWPVNSNSKRTSVSSLVRSRSCQSKRCMEIRLNF